MISTSIFEGGHCFHQQFLNIIYLDAPASAGFSYSTTQVGYNVDDYKSTTQIYEFLKNVCIKKILQQLRNEKFVKSLSISQTLFSG